MKKSVKKLSLGKMTIANLDPSELNQLVGGTGSRAGDCTTKVKPIKK